jgi:hypothetical protein
MKKWGVALKNLRKRYFACKFNNLAHFFQRDEETRNFALWQLSKEQEQEELM